MLSLYLTPTERESLAKGLGLQRALYQAAFDKGLVRVFYSFDGKALSYVAYWRKEYAKVVIHVTGRIEHSDNNLSRALLLFAYDKDSSGTEEELSALYGPDYPTLKTYATLGPKKAKAFLEAASRIDELAFRIGEGKRALRGTSPKLRFVIERNGKGATVSLRVGYTKPLLNRRVGAFIRDYFAQAPVMVQKEFVTLPPHSFSDQEEAALQFLFNASASTYYFNPNVPVFLTEEQLADFLFILADAEAEIDKRNYRIGKPVAVRLSVDAYGALVSHPPIEGETMIRAGNKGYSLKEDIVSLYEFPSAGAGEVYGFFQSLPGLDGSFIADELARKVLPLLDESEVSLDPAFLERHPVRRPEIRYYVGLEDDDVLDYSTRYFLGTHEVDVEEFQAIGRETAERNAAFLKALEDMNLPSSGQRKGDDAIIAFLRTDMSRLKGLAVVFVSDDLQKRSIAAPVDMRLVTSSGEDWFEVKLYSSGYTEEELLQIYSAYHRRKRFVRLSNTYVLLDEEDENLRKISESFAPEDIGVELPLYQALKLPDLGEGCDENVRALIEKVEGYSTLELPSLTEPIESAMRPYQKNGIRFLSNLYRLGLSGILSDDMGLGKTLQSFGLFATIEEDRPMLIVCPKSLIYNWLEERNKWYPDLPAHVLVGSPKERKAIYAKMQKGGKACYFVSYDTLRNDIDAIKDVEFSVALLDEGQYIANAHALKTRAVKEIRASSRFVLTGTPVQNSLLDLWSIFDFLLPGYFPPLHKFKELYGGLEFSSEEARGRLLAKITPFLLGRKKKDVLSELPDKENITMSLAMPTDQRKAYESFLAKAREIMQEESRDKIKLLSLMTRLRQICITPALFLDGQFSSSKIDYLIEALQDLKQGGRKAIVFSSFVSALKLIADRCKEAGLTTESITGETSAKVRVILAERFNKADSPLDVMLVSLKAGGTGLNLIGADTVFHLDPWWNLAAEQQAEDRAHRIGQTRKVTVFKLVIKDSIEEKVLSLQEKKGLLLDMADEASLERTLTDEDYQYLLS